MALTRYRQSAQSEFPFDKYLLFAALALLALGVLMVTSASMVVSKTHFGGSFHFLWRQLFYIAIGFVAGFFVLKTRMAFWEQHSRAFLIVAFILLILVLVPGLGHRVNGSKRWVGLGPFTLQVSEFVKMAFIIYLSSYLVRHQKAVQTEAKGFLKPLAVLGVVALLLLMEPDFGATVVLTMTVLAMIFLGGARAWQFLILFILILGAFALLIVSAPYRMQRLMAFMHPWANQYHSGYQLVQSLIAFGRGGIFGVGLGDSVQKLFYLPESYTDFLFAVLAEELGLIGIVVVIGLYALLVWRGLRVAKRALLAGFPAAGYMAFGLSICLGTQAAINIGVNAGLLPTKGLTLPLMSYGGSSIVITCVIIAILLRVDYETRASGLLRRSR